MARTKGSANFAGSLEVLAGAPLDAREVVGTVEDLTTAATFDYVYVGLKVYVKEKIAFLRSRIYDIGMCIIFDTYLSGGEDLVDNGDE